MESCLQEGHCVAAFQGTSLGLGVGPKELSMNHDAHVIWGAVEVAQCGCCTHFI